MSAVQPARVGVVGVGMMGASHARVYSTLKGADLVAVVDDDREQASQVAAEHGCEAVDSIEALAGRVDAVSIAVPSVHHTEVGLAAMALGFHCLIEKPLAPTEEGALALVDAAQRAGVKLLVGHIERFNPAVRQLAMILEDDDEILAMDARRMSAVSSRITDVDVVADLMVHDLDIVLSIAGPKVVEVMARGAMRSPSPGADYVTAALTLGDGTLATLTASRITQNQVRRLEVTTDRRLLTLDYSSQELHIFRQGRIGGLGTSPPEGSRYVLDVGTERVFVRREEPLVAELSHFLDVVLHDAAPMVSGDDALAVMRVIWEIRRQVDRGGAGDG